LVIPISRKLFFGPQKAFLTGFLRIFFLPANFGGIFHRNMVVEGIAVITVFIRFNRNFSQEFLGNRKFLYLLRIPQESGVFRCPKRVG